MEPAPDNGMPFDDVPPPADTLPAHDAIGFLVCGEWVTRAHGAFFASAHAALHLAAYWPNEPSPDNIRGLMPIGGPLTDNHPDDVRALIYAALVWAAAMVNWPAAWMGLPPTPALFLLSVCGRAPTQGTAPKLALWTALLRTLRDDIAARTPRGFTPPSHLLVGAGETIILPYDWAGPDATDPAYFQAACDDLGIYIPCCFQLVSSAVLGHCSSTKLSQRAWPTWTKFGTPALFLLGVCGRAPIRGTAPNLALWTSLL